MWDESVPNPIQTTDRDAIVATLRKRAAQGKIKLPTDVAFYIEQNVQSNASALEGALIRLATHSSLTGAAITLGDTQRVLKNFIDTQPRKGTVDPLHLLSQQLVTKKAKMTRQDPTAANDHFPLCLLKTQAGRKASRVRHELEVNMRESERERLARRDGYERNLERHAKKRKQG
ncbi:MAG TPA: DnaA/Hda family protein [Candidatus Dormibacteraeota bacterium]|nr:DnaA/Hda family protein [Candidatus Dormibacteraeota bacterium]